VKLSLSVVTLGVANIAVSRKFYETLGLCASRDSNAQVAFFDANGVILALFGRDALAQDALAQDVLAQDAGAENVAPGFSGVTLAWNVAGETEVDSCLARAEHAGARITKPAQKAFWGGYHGYFADPDGHLWEVAYNPFWPLDALKRPQLPAPEVSAPEVPAPEVSAPEVKV